VWGPFIARTAWRVKLANMLAHAKLDSLVLAPPNVDVAKRGEIEVQFITHLLPVDCGCHVNSPPRSKGSAMNDACFDS
jgi:hypothetical protein